MRYEAEAARIRAKLKMTKGARLCGLGSCAVITQGGTAGLRMHRQVVHAGEQWIEQGEGGSK